MEKLSDNRVWLYTEEERRSTGTEYHNFICNFGSKSKFIKLIQSVKWVTPNWVKQRISQSGNDFQLELSKNEPDSFIFYTTPNHFNNDGFEIVKIIKKTDPIPPPK